MVQKFTGQLQDIYEKCLKKNARNGITPDGIIPCARNRNRADSYRTVPREVRAHRDKALRKLSVKTNNKKKVKINKKRCGSKHLTPGRDE